MLTLSVSTQADALSLRALEALSGDPLIEFLMQRRWFGAKGVRPRSARIVNALPLPWDDGAFVIARVETQTEDGTHHHQLPLALVPGLTPGSAALPKAVLARVEWPGGDGMVFDAVEDPRFRRHLADAFGRKDGEVCEGERMRWVIEPVADTPLVVPPNTELRIASSEQSNTSIYFDDMAIFKLYRRLEAGEHPDVEVTRFLTLTAKYPHVPVLLGSAYLEIDGTREVAGMLQELVPKAVDAWQYTIKRGASYFEARRDADPANDYTLDAERLGVITREMHEALASDEHDEAFAPEPATSDDVDRWANNATTWMTRAMDLLERQLSANALPRERTAEAQTLVRRRQHYVEWVHEIAEEIGDDAGFRIRTHGDYHLGQVLRTASDDFMIIDFEGEPARTLAERREKTCALRDVAGMLRSFAYAAATLGTQVAKQQDMTTREIRIGRWERAAREAFLRGYATRGSEESPPGAWHPEGSEHEEPGFLPEEPENVRRLLSLFEAEKVFYELAYELNNRPDWAWIPMRGISKLLVR